MFEPDIVSLSTDDIVVSACQSMENEDGFFGYCLRIENNSRDKIQILSQDLSITDDKGHHFGRTETGFHGEIPELNPGEYFEFEDSFSYDMSGFAVLYGSCRIIKERTNQVTNVKIPALELFFNQSNFSAVLN